jgi:streptogramin lyase
MKKRLRLTLVVLGAVAFAGFVFHILRPGTDAKAAENGVLLTGSVRSATGEAMEGVTVSAKASGSMTTTSVFSGPDGNFYFPRLPQGQYEVRAQAFGFDAGISNIDMTGSVQHQDFKLKTAADVAQQLSGDQWLASLPDDTKENRKMKELLRIDCVGCHSPAFPLENRFDEKGWDKILTLMSRRNDGVTGGSLPDDQPPMPAVNYFKPELAAYLAKMRGPGTSPIKFKLRPRPSGEAALAVVTEYDIPLPDGTTALATGNDWSFGMPGRSGGVHDAQLDWDGNLWFTDWDTNMVRTVGRVDAKTGELTDIRVPAANGFAASTHGIVRDNSGYLWMNVRLQLASRPGEEPRVLAKSALGRIDPKTQKVDLFPTPPGMPGVGSFLDWDGKGNIWTTAGTGALEFDVNTKKYTVFKSPIQATDMGGPGPYGVMGDKEGNGWWSQFSSDMEAKTDAETGKVIEVKLPAHKYDPTLFTPAERKVLELQGESGFFWSTPWGVGPRRPGADKYGNYVYVPGWWSDTLMQIDIHTLKVNEYPMPTKYAGPYMAQVDKFHQVWVEFQNSGTIAKFDPTTTKWTEYNVPTPSCDIHEIGILDHDGPTQIAVACIRDSKVMKFQFRTKDQLAAIRAEVQETASNR